MEQIIEHVSDYLKIDKAEAPVIVDKAIIGGETDIQNLTKKFEGMGKFSHDRGFLFNTGQLNWKKQDWDLLFAGL
ncbi:hypothetical protein COT49_02515 [candidate division WWE3 bacterium CG08_land_8_20_14_0_20_40_13]|uniref:Uncharacterized protein n=1 Tax=candidate division WWE3 bacterium CG08_land_8_20_14_0_20_40_13 TaxID=1975084 RepID=A0A2H0XFP4_UNCKA|nr:MAG: hypothetical protein COT49_02515 [candidate division WWE3 bacterium CG08_land_8_20_14_0_20_40_13]